MHDKRTERLSAKELPNFIRFHSANVSPAPN
jgi:hypothetical protein